MVILDGVVVDNCAYFISHGNMGYGKVQIPTVGGPLIRSTFKRNHLTKSNIQQHPNTIINHIPMEFMLPISPDYSNCSQGV